MNGHSLALLLIEAEFLFDFVTSRARRALDNGSHEDHKLTLITAKVLRCIKREDWICGRIRRKLVVIRAAVIGNQTTDRCALTASHVEDGLYFTTRGERASIGVTDQT